jgi:hypothetical protein
MRSYIFALLVVVAAGGAACGGGDDAGGIGGPSAPSPTSGGSASGGNGGGGSCPRPAPPGNFAATVSFNSVALTWSGVSGANDYLIAVGPNPNTSTTLSTNTTQTAYNWNGVAPGRYYARVEARNSCGSGQPSTEISFTIS